ncbi:glycoside hydrolase family 10 protein [Roseibacillus persicicus]|uniref:glycoside hydrolase family 10 protein n=1 Tax=Roseibacillus persicicus TaxID=454148 RepID=UPI00280D5290|nr:family 10 glycosylhydrolase [Roseibacillus persicicus]MDQ8190804.1 family 10 glycosylhydrolase [Roseibacillus persicicus]
MLRFVAILLLGLFQSCFAQTFSPSREQPPAVPREFRGAWSACVYNIDWPSRKGMSAGSQQAELRAILNRMQSLNMNAIIFQVRPNADAVYNSSLEPWSSWISGTMGRSPGYDPLSFCISEAHARGIEVHAWFNPFRALPNSSMPTARNHVTRTNPSVIRKFKSYSWMDPASSWTRSHALKVMMDVVRRYDIDGLHIDDYFYPYPDLNKDLTPKQKFPDGKTPAQRRAYVDGFVKDMYSAVKREKPWVRVGISPFGIWRPGVPSGTTAKIDAYRHLSADSRKWLANGWCDYLSPQLYWRINSEQSFTRLLSWWRQQGQRPVWPGVATSRINSSEDPGRPASEIVNQLNLTRTVGRNWVGHVHWSMKSLMENRGGINSALQRNFYAEAALVPPMPWLSTKAPPSPRVSATETSSGVQVQWNRVSGGAKYAVQARYGKTWRCIKVLSGGSSGVTVPAGAQAVAVTAVDRFGTASAPSVLSAR